MLVILMQAFRLPRLQGLRGKDMGGKRGVLFGHSCSIILYESGRSESIKIPGGDYYCNSFSWGPDGALYFSGSPVGGSSYGASYSIRRLELATKAVTTLVSGDAQTLYHLLGVLRDGKLLFMRHVLDRTPTFTLELSDSTGQNRKALFGSNNEFGYFGELNRAQSQLSLTTSHPLLSKARAIGIAPITSNEQIQRARKELLTSGPRRLPPSLYPKPLSNFSEKREEICLVGNQGTSEHIAGFAERGMEAQAKLNCMSSDLTGLAIAEVGRTTANSGR